MSPLGDRLAHHLGRLGLGLRETLARLGVAERGFAPAFGFQDLRLLLAFGLEDRRLALAFGFENDGALLALGLHLPAHRLHEVGGRHDVLDLDAVDLDAPGRHRGVDHAQQPLVDLVAMRQHLVEIHAAHHRADVGHGELDDGLVEIGDLVARLGGVEHLEERDAVDGDGGVVLGDDILLRDVDHLLHHVHSCGRCGRKRHDQIEAGLQRAGVAAEPLDGPVIALRHRLDAGEQRQNDKRYKHEHKYTGAADNPVHGRLPSITSNHIGGRPAARQARPESCTRFNMVAVVTDFAVKANLAVCRMG